MSTGLPQKLSHILGKLTPLRFFTPVPVMAARILSCQVEFQVNFQLVMISEAAGNSDSPGTDVFLAPCSLSSWAVRVRGLYSLHFMFFPFRLKYVKISLQCLNKVSKE